MVNVFLLISNHNYENLSKNWSESKLLFQFFSLAQKHIYYVKNNALLIVSILYNCLLYITFERLRP